MKSILSILILFSLFSCKEKEPITNNASAVQKVLNFYSGECIKSKGFKSKNGINKSYFELEISKSELLNNDSKNIKTHSANIAYIFYSSLPQNEKRNYDEIKVTIDLSTGVSERFIYSTKELEEIKKLQPTIDLVIENIVGKKYNELSLLFDQSVNINTGTLQDLFNSVENQYGQIKKNQFQGFEFKTAKQFGDAIIVKEAITFQKFAISMSIILKRDNLKIIAIEFE